MTASVGLTTLRIGRSPIPTLRPMLGKPAPSPFDSPDHLFEVLWGGVRALLTVEGGRVRLHGRNLTDLSDRFPEILGVSKQLRKDGVVLDGEIVALDADGRPEVTLLRKRLDPLAPGSTPAVTFQVSDILYLEGRPVLSRPLIERRHLLRRTLTPTELASAIEEVGTEGIAFYQAALNLKLPGVIAKDRGGIYLPGRISGDWREIRIESAGEFVIGGYTLTRTKRRTTLEGLLLGVPGSNGLTFVGHVTGTFTASETAAIERAIAPLVTATNPFSAVPGLPRLVYWCRPEQVAEVRFSGWSASALLRFPLFGTLRPDLSPRDCVYPAPNLAAG